MSWNKKSGVHVASVPGLLVPQHKQSRHFLLATLPQKKLLSRCQLLCLSRWFSFAHAWIFYQRGLIRIKCLKALQTPGDLNHFWLDLQTKQTIMMQACVKMYTAVQQQMPALDAFINVVSSFHQLLSISLHLSTGVCVCSCRGAKKRAVINSCRQTEGNVSSSASVLALQTQISLGTAKGIAVCSMQDVIKYIQIFLQSVGRKTAILLKRCIFWDDIISPLTLLLLPSKQHYILNTIL